MHCSCFFRYIRTSSIAPEIFDEKWLDKAQADLSFYAQSMRTEIAKQKHKFREQDATAVESLIPLLQSYERSLHNRTATTLLGGWKEQQQPTIEDIRIVRDHLITQLLLLNGQRAGAIANATVEDFLQAKKVGDSDEYVIVIFNHKTAASGPARLTLTATLREKMKRYLGKRTSGPLFTRDDGQAIPSSYIARALKRTLGEEASATRVRKATVCIVRILLKLII